MRLDRKAKVINMNILVTIPRGDIFSSFIPSSVQKRLSALGDVEYNERTKQFTSEELRNKLYGKDAVITGWGSVTIDEKVLEGNNSLKIIAHTGGSVQGVVSNAVYNKGIIVLSGNNIYAESVAESVIAYALTALRKIPDYINLMGSGGWNEEIPIWEGLLDQKIGLVGYGMTAQHLVKMLEPFRCKIYVHSNHISDHELRVHHMVRATLDEIFSTCKIVSLHAAMTQKNYHMIDRRLLEMLSPEAILINTARGGIVDEAALTELLAQRRFRAVLDVFEEEPLPKYSDLRKIPGVYPIPHRAGPTYDRRQFVTLALADDIENYFLGRPMQLEITKEYAGFMTKE
jgi:phosphoglycerate dehydrogenase-like enzyme